MFQFFSQFGNPQRYPLKPRSDRRRRYQQLHLDSLDARCLLSVSPLYAAEVKTQDYALYRPSQQEIDKQMGLPVLNSLPGATATLYLDFNGNYLSSWSADGNTWTNVRTPVFDMDGNTATFNADEQAVIKEVWARVAEDYAPFNINVSTAYYGGFDNGQAVRVACGGDWNDWLGSDNSGYASIGSFQDSEPNVCFAFDMTKWARAGVQDWEGRTINGAEAWATTITHEAGHTFGLHHHSVYDVNGEVVDWYDKGSSNWTPIMGNNLAHDRTTWAYLPTDEGANVWQDDMAELAALFGYRADDHGNTIATADALTSSGPVYSVYNTLGGSGIIGQNGDRDYFKFTAQGGQVQIQVDSAKYGPNMLPVLQLYSSSGLVANASYVTATRSIVYANLTAGQTYYVMVKSVGFYGDVGQYTVSVKNTMSYQMTEMSTATMTTKSSPYLTETSTKSLSSGAGQGAGFDTSTLPILSPTTNAFETYAPANVVKSANGLNRLPLLSQKPAEVLRTAINAAFEFEGRNGGLRRVKVG